MTLRTRLWCLCCMLLAAGFMAKLAYDSFEAYHDKLPYEVYAELNRTKGAQYYMKLQDGYVAVYADERGSRLIAKTAISTDKLRRADRAMLKKGIPAKDSDALLKLLEDFGV